jgi:hypothetical protein
LSENEPHINTTNGPVIPIPEDRRFGVLMLMISGNVRPNWRKVCPRTILCTTHPTLTVMGFEGGRLLSELGDYTPIYFTTSTGNNGTQ